MDYTPGAFRKVRTVRRKFVRKNTVDAKPIIAPLPPKLQDGCMAAPGLLANILVSRYVDHLPFYRQETIFKTRHEVLIPRQNMVRWMEMVADRLEPLYNILKDGVHSGDYIQMDETPVRYLDPKGGGQQAPLGYMWVTSRPGGDTIFHWNTSRSAQCIKDILPKTFAGILLSAVTSKCTTCGHFKVHHLGRGFFSSFLTCLARCSLRFFAAQPRLSAAG